MAKDYEYKTKVSFKFQAEEPQVPGPIQSFELVREERHFTRTVGAKNWHEQFATFKRETVGDGITRNMMADIISDIAGWLSYIEDDDS